MPTGPFEPIPLTTRTLQRIPEDPLLAPQRLHRVHPRGFSRL